MRHFLLFCLLLVTGQLTAQVNRTDSLWQALKNHPQADTFRVNRINDLTNEWGLPIHQYDSLANEALTLSRKLGYEIGQAKALFTLGTVQYANSRNDPAKQAEMQQGQQKLDQSIRLAEHANDKQLLISMLMGTSAAKRVSNTEKKQALTYAQRALALAKAIPDPNLIGECQRMIGYYYDWVEGNYAAALQWNFEALQTAQSAGCQDCELPPLRAIADNYTALNDTEQALRYLNQALTLSRKLTSKTSRDYQFFSLSALGNLYKMLGQYPQAVKAYEQAIQVRQKDYPNTTLAFFDRQLAAIYELQKRYPLAISHAQRGLMQARQDHNAWGEAINANTLGRAYLHTGRLDSAQFYGNQSFTIAQQTHKKEFIRDASQTLAELYARQGKYTDAYRYQGLYFTYRDSLNNEDLNRKATAARFTYQIGQQQSQLKLQAQTVREQRFQRNALLLAGLFLLVLGITIAAWLLNRAKLRRLEEAQHLRRQIAQDLHDEVGSTLSSISLLSGHTDKLLSENRPETAQKMVQKIYTDARQILESIDEIIWTINPGNDSLHRIAMRLQEYAQPLMESKHIRFTFQIDPTLEETPISMEVRRNLYLIGKEAINNLIKYSEATQATIRFERKETKLQVLIEDNGRGFVQDGASTRNGQQSMKERAEAIGGSLNVQSAPGQGTSLVLTTSLA